MALDYAKTAEEIMKQIGGPSNVVSVTHCMTRLRLVLADESKADDTQVKRIKGVKSVVKQGGQYQVIIGNEVSDVCTAFQKLGNFSESKAEAGPKQDETIIDKVLNYISGSMTALLPAMIGCGMIKVVLILLTTSRLVSTDSSTYILLNGMGDAFFNFLPVLLAYTTAVKLQSKPIVAMAIAASLLYPNITALLSEGTTGTFLGMSCTYLFGIPVISQNYASSVFPILLLAPFIKIIGDWAERVSPKMLRTFMAPLITILICDLLGFIVIGPIGGVVGAGLAQVIDWLYSTAGWLTIGIVSALMPLLVMTGMHYALLPLTTISLSSVGYDAILVITMFCSNIAQGAASIGVSVKTKNKELKSEGIACGVSAIVAGVTEPALYGINLRYKTPLIAAMAAGGISGLFAGIFHVAAYSMSGSCSLITLLQMISDDGMSNMYFGAIAGLIAIVTAFILTIVLYKDEKEESEEGLEKPEQEKRTERIGEEAGAAAADTEHSLQKEAVIAAPIKGKIRPLSDCSDEAFASEAMGKGILIEPSEGEVFAPADGTIDMVFDTGHALGMTTDEGAELLIHVGMDTVSMKGEGFSPKVQAGDKVKQGELLMEFDIQRIYDRGLKTETPVIVTNTDEFSGIKVV